MSTVEGLYSRSPVWFQTLMLNAHAWRIQRHRYGPIYQTAVKRAMANERLPREEIRAYQNQRLRNIVRAAYERSAYYREVFQARGIQPSHITKVEDLQRLPLLTKEVVRERGSELMTRDRPGPGWLHGHTSGTTGSPLGLWYDRNTCIVNNAVDRRHKVWAGIPENAWIGLFLGRVIVPPEQTKPPFWRANRVQREVWFSSFHLSDDWLDAYVKEIRRRQLRYLEGYPSTLYILANYLRRRGETLPMRAVITSSETLLALQRDTIETAFDCELFDFYALAERVIYACECEAHQGKHVAEDYGYLELVNDDGVPVGDGETGYLVGTSLHNVAMPMIRYRTNDISAIVSEPCSCGRTFIRVRDVTTKAEDIVVTPDGRMISPSILTHPFKPFDQIVKSQIVQRSPEHVLVKIVPSASFTSTHESMLTESLRQRLGPRVEIEIKIVEDIPRTAAGKFRWVVSLVDHPSALKWDDEAA